jgi:hypothetical protein
VERKISINFTTALSYVFLHTLLFCGEEKNMGAMSAKAVLALINAIHIAKIADEGINQF